MCRPTDGKCLSSSNEANRLLRLLKTSLLPSSLSLSLVPYVWRQRGRVVEAGDKSENLRQSKTTWLLRGIICVYLQNCSVGVCLSRSTCFRSAHSESETEHQAREGELLCQVYTTWVRACTSGLSILNTSLYISHTSIIHLHLSLCLRLVHHGAGSCCRCDSLQSVWNLSNYLRLAWQ